MMAFLLAVIYLSFISLGLPDSVLGAAWPSMMSSFSVPVSFAGIVSVIISCGTISSSLLSGRLTQKLSSGKITALSVALTAVALAGFSFSTEFWQICLWAVPYGLGAGSVDVVLNNYVALHYSSMQMSFLHCMWGVGAATGPNIMAYALATKACWQMGYRYISVIQICLAAILFLSLPLWGKQSKISASEAQEQKPLSLRQVLKIRGVKEAAFTFFFYCAVECTAGLWAASYIAITRNIEAEKVAKVASLFYLGITAGRALSGFVNRKLTDTQMVRLGQAVIFAGLAFVFVPVPYVVTLGALVLVGLGCAPIFPSMIHATPTRFGAGNSQAVIGLQMAFAYIGILTMPPLFGLLANHISVWLYPVFLLAMLALMFVLHERTTALTRR